MMDFMKKMEAKLSAQISQVNEGVNGVNVKLENVESTVRTMDATLKSLVSENDVRKEEYERICKENIELKKDVEEVLERVRELEQYSRRDNLEIVGVPYTQGEDVYHIMGKVANILKVTFNRNDISVVHRLPVTKSRPHPNIIVKFIYRDLKSDWLRAAKAYRKSLTAAELSDSWPSTNIYVNEHLTQHNKTVLGKARRFVKGKQLAHAWSREGKVFARKSWDVNSPGVLLKTERDVEELATRRPTTD